MTLEEFYCRDNQGLVVNERNMVFIDGYGVEFALPLI